MKVTVPQVVADRERMFGHLRQHASNRVPKRVPPTPVIPIRVNAAESSSLTLKLNLTACTRLGSFIQSCLDDCDHEPLCQSLGGGRFLYHVRCDTQVHEDVNVAKVVIARKAVLPSLANGWGRGASGLLHKQF